MAEAPQALGVVMVFTDEHGRFITEATDFDPQAFSSFTVKHSQEIRCRKLLARRVIEAYASPQLARAIGEYEGEKIINQLRDAHKCQVRTIYVGHADD